MSVFTMYPQNAQIALDKVSTEKKDTQFHTDCTKLINLLIDIAKNPNQNLEKDKFIKTQDGWAKNPRWKNTQFLNI